MFVAGNSALTVPIPVHLARNGHLSTAEIGLVVGKIVLPVGGVAAHMWSIATMLRVVPVGLPLLYLALALPARRRAAISAV